MASSTPPPHCPISQSRIHHPFNHLQKQPNKCHHKYPSPSSSSSSVSSSSTSVSVRPAHLNGSNPICPSSTTQNVLRPGKHGVFSPLGQKLGPEFQGNRSTRVVSKRNINRPRWGNANYNNRAPPSPSAVDCLNQLIHLPSTEENTMTEMLLSFGVSLSGPDDYGYLVRELGEQGDCSKIVRCFRFGIPRMRDPTERGKLLTAVISSLGRMGRTDLAKEAFDVGLNEGYGKTVYAYSALISAYARSGLSTGALAVFESMKAIGMKPNSVTYNTVIDACVKGGEDLHRTTEVFREMLRNGVRPDRITFNSLLAGCSRARHWENARLMYDEMVHLGIGRDVFTYNTFIDAICKCGNMELAVQIMSEMPNNNLNPNVVTYSTLMDGYSKLERYDAALNLYEEVKRLSIPMDRVCFNTLLSIYVKMERYEDVVRTSEEMEKLGIDRDVVTYNALVAGYGKQARFEVVGYLTKKMGVEGIVPNVLTYSTLIDVYSKAGMFEKAMEVYQEFRESGLRSDVVLYSSLIDTLCKNGMVESAVYLLKDMIMVGIRPNVVTYNSVINAFGMGRIQDTHKQDDQASRGTRGTRGTGTSNELFSILELFRGMQHLGIKPNVVTFSSILNACSHCDSFEDASMLLEQLRSFDNHVYGITHGLLNGSNEGWKAAKVLFDDLKRLDSSTAAAFYNALTDMLWHFGQRRGAQQVVFEGRRRNVWENSWTESCLDLHLMSSGASQATVYAWLLDIRSVVYEGRELPFLISILTGWGKHSKVSGSSTLRRGVEMLLVSLAAPFHVERFNFGRFVFHGTELAVWLRESCPLSSLVLRDDRTRTENGLLVKQQLKQLPHNLQALTL